MPWNFVYVFFAMLCLLFLSFSRPCRTLRAPYQLSNVRMLKLFVLEPRFDRLAHVNVWNGVRPMSNMPCVFQFHSSCELSIRWRAGPANSHGMTVLGIRYCGHFCFPNALNETLQYSVQLECILYQSMIVRAVAISMLNIMERTTTYMRCNLRCSNH